MTATAEAPERVRLTRDQAADRLLELLNDEPQTLTSLRQRILGPEARGGRDDVIRSGLKVLESRREAKQIPRRGWTVWDSEHQAAISEALSVDWPMMGGTMIRLDEMFVDKIYQRPLTSFVAAIVNDFDPRLWQTLALSDRGPKSPKGRRYALIDGQTRWAAGTRLGIVEGPCIIYADISPAEEAELFAKFQTKRKGMVSWHRFRADLAAGNPESLAIQKLANDAGYILGDQDGQLRSVAALESTYRSDAYQLERLLHDYHDAWPDVVPESPHIRGMHYFFRHYPLNSKKRRPKGHIEVVDDERLVRRLKTTGAEELKRKASLIREAEEGRGANDKYMAQAIQNLYLGGGRR